MTRPPWIILCLLAVTTLGCRTARKTHVVTEPNTPPATADISADSNDSASDPNAAFQPEMFILSGSLAEGSVLLKGVPGDPCSRSDGTYHVTVDAGWSGTVTPEKEGFLFWPPSRTYEPFTRDIHHEIYIPKAISDANAPLRSKVACTESQALTGTLMMGGVPLQGITLHAVTTSLTAVTDANGFFSLSVPTRWTGTLRLQAPKPVRPAEVMQKPVLVCDLDVVVPDNVSVVNIETPPEASDTTGLPDDPLLTLGPPALSCEAMDALHQDLAVMCLLLSEEAYGVSLVKRDPNSEPKAIYLPGDGVLFNVSLDWPLAGQLLEPGNSTNSIEWRTARQFIERRSAPVSVQEALHHMKTRAFVRKMTHSLIHGAHIRHLPDDSHITLHILGPAPSKSLLVRAPKGLINDYAEGVLTDEAFEGEVELKLH